MARGHRSLPAAPVSSTPTREEQMERLRALLGPKRRRKPTQLAAAVQGTPDSHTAGPAHVVQWSDGLPELAPAEPGAPRWRAEQLLSGPSKGALVAPLADACAALDGLIRIPGAPCRLPVKSNSSLTTSVGRFLSARVRSNGRIGIVPVGIDASPREGDLAFALTHEFGHFLYDGMIMPSRRSLPADVTEALAALRVANESTEAHQGIVAKAVEIGEWRDGINHALYLKQENEVFARAFAQWVATSDGASDELRASTRAAQEDPSYCGAQWSDEEFARIAPHVERVIDALGWRA